MTPSTRYLSRILMVPLILFIIMRLGFWWAFSSGESASYHDILKAWGLGLRYDLRVALVLALPNILLFNFRFFNPRWSKSARRWWKNYWVIAMTLAFAFYLFDFGYYQYLKTHTNATALQFLLDFNISMQMVWQSYPVIKAFLTIAAFAVFYNILFSRFILPDVDKSIENISFKQSFNNGIIATAVVIGGLYGKVSTYPLRWSDAYFSNSAFTAALAVNPIHYFFDTFKYRKTEYDKEKVKKYISSVRGYLGLSSENAIDLKREILPPPLENPVNVVVIVLESQAAYKTGIFGNPANPTPYLDQIAKKATLFRKHFVPSEGTARSIFGILTAIPDVNTNNTSSRNPLIASQNLIINSFTDAKKFYFLGGSTSWGNIRGLISYNIPDLEIVEEGSFASERNDVWGVSDLDLFKEAHKRFQSTHTNGQPFFAVIQTAGFHRPYTIPKNHDDFKLADVTAEKIKDGGFDSADELNSLRFQDYSLGKFFELAEKSEYFKNTLFVIQGDHGLPDNKAKNLLPGEIYFGLSRWHVPLIFYSPRLLPDPKGIDEISSELDVMTTVASLAGKPHTNTTLGRNLFDPNLPASRFALLYTYYENPPGIALIDDKYLVRCNARLTCSGIFDYTSASPQTDLNATEGERYQKMQDLTFGLYETSKYLLYNNSNPLIKK